MEVIDRAKLEEVRRSTELGSNPFDHIPLGLVSVDFLKQERVLEQLDRASYDAVDHFAGCHGSRVLAEYKEVETGKRADRPELAKAIAQAKRSRATLDRLARNVAFTSCGHVGGSESKRIEPDDRLLSQQPGRTFAADV